jgi:5'-phosphate synthase pdxT subunit
MLERLGVPYRFVRTPQDAEGVDAVILPGGESTTMLKFLQEEGLEAALRTLREKGAAFFATCAGAILVAREVRGPSQLSLGFADLAVRRNAYGRQVSSEVRAVASKLKNEPLEMVFIRAPVIEEAGPDVEVLASDRGRPVLVRQGNLLVATFHPELTQDTTVHEYFLKLVSPAAPRLGRTGSPEKAAKPR